MQRRAFMVALLLAAQRTMAGNNPPASDPTVVPGRLLRFPDDEGSHPEFRIEWWYVTGWLETQARPVGFQVTFFRTRTTGGAADNPSRFTPHHLLIGHAALADPRNGRLLAAQRVARAGFGLAEARTGRTDVWIDDWRLQQDGTNYQCSLAADDFRLALQFTRTQAPLLHGDRGYSRKGPRPESASYYYTHPQLAVGGSIASRSLTGPVHGVAWFDHEWSTAPMDEQAVGWDWIGINLDDGGSLMAFRMRGRDGPDHWAGATVRQANGETRSFDPASVHWRALRHWRSPRTGGNYPVSFEVRIRDLVLIVDPMMDDQENDARGSAGTVYWEGAVTAMQAGRRVGRGYLELTGYVRPLRL
jgi:predicted secreted hydrolase